MLNLPQIPETQAWKTSSHSARLWHPLEKGVVQCRLSPRNCVLKEGQYGFCGVRKNVGGELRSLDYGKSVHATQEFVETEALNHFAPWIEDPVDGQPWLHDELRLLP